MIIGYESELAADSLLLRPACRYWRVSTHSTISFASASDKPGFGGMGTGPHTPWPPSLTLRTSAAGAPALAL